MKRKAIEKLIKWKDKDNRTPILINGAKGVGKTYLAYDFAKAFFERIIYVNFERDPNLKKIFASNDIGQIIDTLEKCYTCQEKEEYQTEILIFDEAGYYEEAVRLLKIPRFTERFPYILSITGSQIPDEYESKLDKLTIYPLEFDEFLIATGNEWYIDLIYTHYNNNRKLPDIVHKELLDLYYLYLRIGGMPSSVNEYLNFTSTVNTSEQHRIMLGFIHDCINKEFEESDSLKMLQVMDSISHQLAKENKKFQYRLIRKGTTFSMYKEAIQNLIDKKYVIRCNKINNEQLVISSAITKPGDNNCEETNSSFKLYMLDIGLLYSLLTEEITPPFIPSVDKALLENYVAQSLQAKQYPFVFWESDSIAKIDFVLCKENELIPLEIHTGSNTRSKSLSIMKQKYEFPYALKVSARNFELSGNIKYIPYYAVFCI